MGMPEASLYVTQRAPTAAACPSRRPALIRTRNEANPGPSHRHVDAADGGSGPSPRHRPWGHRGAAGLRPCCAGHRAGAGWPPCPRLATASPRTKTVGSSQNPVSRSALARGETFAGTRFSRVFHHVIASFVSSFHHQESVILKSKMN